ncbi:MAG: glycosyltransferase family 2 protein [Acidobacteria bacterium]|nr:glycosyltransferase family 2 protein [Acidobacteriota bacterium]
MHTVSVIIPYYRCLAYLKPCVQAIIKSTLYPIHELIIVNDGSENFGSVRDFINEQKGKARFRIKLIDRRRNKGFAFTCNEGASHATGEFLVFLNADTVPLEGWLLAMVGLLNDNPDAGIVGSRLLYPDCNLIQHVGGAIDNQKKPFHVYCTTPAFLPFLNKDRTLQWATGACFLIRRKEFAALSGFDETYISYCEDADLCFRMRRQFDREVMVAGNSILYHCESVTKVGKQLTARSLPILFMRWKSFMVPDECQIYESDGFSPRFLSLMESVCPGKSKSMELAYVLPSLMNLNSLQKQDAYAKEKDISGFLHDLKKAAHRVSPRFFSRYPDLHLRIYSGAPENIDATAIQLHDLFVMLSHNSISKQAKKKLVGLLPIKLDDANFFTWAYNLASLAKEQGEEEGARSLFKMVSEMASSANPELAGKANFKVAQLVPETGEKAKYLRRCLRLYPQHMAARTALEQMKLDDRI